MQPGLPNQRGWCVVACVSIAALLTAGASPATAEEPVAEPSPECRCSETRFDWTGFPDVQTFPRPGSFPVKSGGSGYYSLMDAVTGRLREAPAPSGYPAAAPMPPSLFDADFRFLDDVPRSEQSFSERLKRIRIGDDFLISTGGQAWSRFMNEHNSRLGETDDSYNLGRVRVFGDLWYRDLVRVYAEFLAADRFSEELAPRGTDINRGDLLNLFADVKLLDGGGDPVYARVGRQELLFGSQRLVSTLDWSNVRRTFQGVRVFRRTDKLDVDAFWTQFVPADANDFDHPDENRDFYGAWMTYRPQKGHFVDLYYLGFSNDNGVTQQGITRAPFDRHTLGTRYAGDWRNFLWDFEGAVQLGDEAGRDVTAAMATAGGGYHFTEALLDPTFWIYYDFASGDGSPGSGEVNTFNQLFPFGHYYMGWTDLVGRQNIHDLNLHLRLFPTKWMSVWLQYHRYWLHHDRDALYNAGGNAIRRDPSGNAGNDVGHEFDLVLNFHINGYSDILTGYSKLYGGDFLQRTSGPAAAVDSELYYLQYNVRW